MIRRTIRRRLAPSARVLIPILFVPFFLAAVQTASAQDAISELTVIWGDNPGIQAPEGYTRLNTDLNWGAGGAFIYACYKKGVGAPITGLAVTVNNGSPPAGFDWVKIPTDLNYLHIGSDRIYLHYTRDPACSRLLDLIVLDGQSTPPPDGYVKIPRDLNQNAGGHFLYFAYLMD